MTEQNSQQHSQKSIIWLFVKRFVVILLALAPIVFYFIVVFPWSSGRSYHEEVYYLEHYMAQDPNDTTALLERWNRQFFVLEVDEELFRAGAFDRVLILITPGKNKSTLNIDYIGSDFHSDILSHHRETNKFYLGTISYDIYDWGISNDVLTIHLGSSWFLATIYFVLAAAAGTLIFLSGDKIMKTDLKLFKKKKKE